MNRIEIIHNPFTVDTQFLINGQLPAPGCELSSYKERRLQAWVEMLFDELAELFNGDEDYEIVFTGVESDFLDIAEAVQAAEARGARVKLDWRQAASSEARQAAILALIQEVREHEEFARYIGRNDAIKLALDESFDRDFDVYVVATMSSGKSTLINAMLGRDLLPAANEATTATIVRIADDESIGERFEAVRRGDGAQILERLENATYDDIERWNKEKDTHQIEIAGNIKGVRERDHVRLVLTDTPGPNNSQDDRHQIRTMSFIQDSVRNPLILYVLNGTQLGTNDDRHLLGLVADVMARGGKQSKDRFVFVVNKMDDFDPEKEDIPSVLNRVRSYLSENGIHNPLVYPISANLTRLLRKAADKHTRAEGAFLREKTDLFREEPAMNMLQYMPITSRVRRNLADRGLSPLMQSSGLPAVESMIDEYIDKYFFPHRVKRAYDALTKAIEIGSMQARLDETLDLDEQALQSINEQIRRLQEHKERALDANTFREEIKRSGLILPDDVLERLTELEMRPTRILRQLAEQFRSGDVPVDSGRKLIEEAEARIRFEFKALVNDYEVAFAKCQAWASEELNREYQARMAALFKDCGALDLPIFEMVLQSAGGISVDLSIRDAEVGSRSVVVGMREESDSIWYNPLSWFRKKSVAVYGNESYIELNKVWGERQTLIEAEFMKLIGDARSQIRSKQESLIDRFVALMSEELDPRLDEMLSSLSKKVAEREEREQSIARAKRLQATIARFKMQLDETLAV